MFTVKLEFNPEQILSARGLNPNGKAQKYFTNQCINHMDKYIPYRRGGLKNTRIANIDNVVYEMPYARRQFYTNRGNGIDGINHGGLRGPHWSNRMWNSEGDEILRDLAELVGGHL